MICIAVVNSKGGTGKTTLTAALAVRAAKDSGRVAAVDLDPQHSLAAWFHRRGNKGDNPRVFADEASADAAREALELDGWDFVLLDGPPGALDATKEMIAAADFVVVPVKTSALDIVATRDVTNEVKRVKRKYLVVLNDRFAQDRLHEDVRRFLEGEGIPVAATEIAHRKPYITAMTSGQTAAEINRDAACEIDALWAEVKAAAGRAARAKRGAAR
jgi:chromosome partitioning protein